jgi:hypothetical protein
MTQMTEEELAWKLGGFRLINFYIQQSFSPLLLVLLFAASTTQGLSYGVVNEASFVQVCFEDIK